MGWIDEEYDKAKTPTMDKIFKRSKEMAAPTMEREAAHSVTKSQHKVSVTLGCTLTHKKTAITQAAQ